LVRVHWGKALRCKFAHGWPIRLDGSIGSAEVVEVLVASVGIPQINPLHNAEHATFDDKCIPDPPCARRANLKCSPEGGSKVQIHPQISACVNLERNRCRRRWTGHTVGRSHRVRGGNWSPSAASVGIPRGGPHGTLNMRLSTTRTYLICPV
jgi:hypothetical protein